MCAPHLRVGCLDRPFINRTVIGVDFAAGSANAVRWVRRRFAPRAQLLLVHAEHPLAPWRLETDPLVRS